MVRNQNAFYVLCVLGPFGGYVMDWNVSHGDRGCLCFLVSDCDTSKQVGIPPPKADEALKFPCRFQLFRTESKGAPPAKDVWLGGTAPPEVLSTGKVKKRSEVRLSGADISLSYRSSRQYTVVFGQLVPIPEQPQLRCVSLRASIFNGYIRGMGTIRQRYAAAH